MDLVIRRARRSDKRGVLAAVRTIWGGQDRIPDVFDSWVTHRTGPFFVAESGGRIVGMGKLTVVSPTEAWLEGGRVAPRWRRKGIATALIAHRIAYARDRGFRVLRFSTASDNTPIHRAARHFGFTRVGALSRREATARPGQLLVRATSAPGPDVGSSTTCPSMCRTPRIAVPLGPPATQGPGRARSISLRRDLRDELDERPRLLHGDVLTVDGLRVELRHPHDLVLIPAAHLESARAPKASEFSHDSLLPLVPV